jgi:hypothetical protein
MKLIFLLLIQLITASNISLLNDEPYYSVPIINETVDYSDYSALTLNTSTTSLPTTTTTSCDVSSLSVNDLLNIVISYVSGSSVTPTSNQCNGSTLPTINSLLYFSLISLYLFNINEWMWKNLLLL